MTRGSLRQVTTLIVKQVVNRPSPHCNLGHPSKMGANPVRFTVNSVTLRNWERTRFCKLDHSSNGKRTRGSSATLRKWELARTCFSHFSFRTSLPELGSLELIPTSLAGAQLVSSTQASNFAVSAPTTNRNRLRSWEQCPQRT